MKKLVIHCASGIQNTGDEAILDVVLKDFGEICDITVISLDAKCSEKMHPKVRFLSNGDPAWKEAVRSCDVFLLGGGGLLQDKTTFFNVSRWLEKLKYALICGKMTVIYANSLEELRFSWNKRRVEKYLRLADVITLRDPMSLEIAKRMGITKGILTADPVYSYSVEEVEIPADLPEKFAVMTVRHWYDTHPLIPVRICSRLGIRTRKNQKSYERYIKELTRIADYLNKEKGIAVVWLSCCYGRDAKVAKDVCKRVKKPSMHRIIDQEYMRPSEAMAVVKGGSLLIGMRLHSFIYAFLVGTPVLMLAYQDKVRGMARMAGIEENCFDIDNFQAEEVEPWIDRLLENPILQREKIAAFVEKMRRMHKINIQKVLGLLGENDE